MTREEFIFILIDKGYPYKIEGNKVVVTREGYVYLDNLTSLPPDVEFKNGQDVYLHSLLSISPGVVFENQGHVFLDSLTSIPPGVVFENGGDVKLESLTDCWFDDWEGHIKGIYNRRLLNKMISIGLFER